MTDKIRKFLEERRPDTPCLVVDLDVVARNYTDLARVLPQVVIYYSVKSNQAKEIMTTLIPLRGHLNTSSRHEL